MRRVTQTAARYRAMPAAKKQTWHSAYRKAVAAFPFRYPRKNAVSTRQIYNGTIA